MLSLAFVKLEGSGKRDPDPVLATNRGIDPAREERLLEHLGEVASACAAFRQASESGAPHLQARIAYEIAISSTDAYMAAWAEHELGVMLEQHGDIAGARHAYEQVIARKERDTLAMAASRLRAIAPG